MVQRDLARVVGGGGLQSDHDGYCAVLAARIGDAEGELNDVVSGVPPSGLWFVFFIDWQIQVLFRRAGGHGSTSGRMPDATSVSAAPIPIFWPNT